MGDNVIRFADYEKRSREPDALGPRDPTEADVVAIPAHRVRRSYHPVFAVVQRKPAPFVFDD